MPDDLDRLLTAADLSDADRAAVSAHADTLLAAAEEEPEHSHLADYTGVQGCPRCMQLGAVNPDTGSPWPSLDAHGQQVLAETADRFSDRYDGENHATALDAALREAYLRGRMQGRTEQRRDAALSARGALMNALLHLRSALDAAEKDDERTAASHAGLASAHLDAARTYRHVAGNVQ